jgi:hypothetical protein
MMTSNDMVNHSSTRPEGRGGLRSLHGANPVLAICGGGNGGHALAVVASQNFDGDVTWLVGSDDKAIVVQNSCSGDGLSSTGVIKGSASKVRVVSADPADVIPQADIVLIVVPAFAHAAVLGQIAPYLKESALIGCLPTRGGFEFEASTFIPGIEPAGRRRIFGLQTLPWSTRVVEPGKLVNFGALKAKVLLATRPAGLADELSILLTQLLGLEIVPTAGLLNMTLGNPGQLIHPGLMYGHFRSWSDERFEPDEVPYFYAEATDEMGAFVEQMSEEAVAVAKAIAARSRRQLDVSGVLPIHEWLQISYPSQTADTTSTATCFRTGPLQARRAPMLEIAPGELVPNFDYRYLSEDVPYGLVVTRAIAELAQVATPAIDAVILWAQDRMDKQYLIDGRVRGRDTHGLPIPQHFGVDTLERLLDWYVDEGPAAHGLEAETG